MDKEKKVIFRKAKELGVPKDECEIILEGLVLKNPKPVRKSKELPAEKLNKKQEEIIDSRQPVKKEDKSSKKSSNLKLYGFGCAWGCLGMILALFISMLSVEYLGADIFSGFLGMFIFIFVFIPPFTYIGKKVAVSLGIVAFKERPLTKGVNKDIEKFEKRKNENSKTQTKTKEPKKIVNKDIAKIEKRRGRKG